MSLMPRKSLFDFEDMFDAWRPLRSVESTGDGFTPRVDIKDKDDHYEITAELPGVNKEDLNISLDNGVLSIQAETKREDTEEKDGKIIRQERRYGKFMRSFNLGGEVQEEDIKASFADGVLTLEAPKLKEKAPERRRIEIS